MLTFFRLWRLDGTWLSIHDRLRRKFRRAVGRHSKASAAILDSQSVKTTEKGGARLRRRQENQGQKKAHFDRYAGVNSETSCSRGQHSRPSGCKRFDLAAENQALAFEKDLG